MNFLEVGKRAYSLFVGEESTENVPSEESASRTETDLFDTLRDHLDIDAKFSEARCAKVLPLALATYQQNSPFHYTREYHENRVSFSIRYILLSLIGVFHVKPDFVSVLSLPRQCRFWLCTVADQ